jgi:sulfur carrier protein
MNLIVNGVPREIPDGARIPELLTLLQIPAGQVAVEVNGEVVRRARHAEVQLQPGDQVEVVNFVGGG